VDAVEAELRGSSWPELVERSGVARAEIDRAVALLAEARRGIFCWAMGSPSRHGVDNAPGARESCARRGWLVARARASSRSAVTPTSRAVGSCGVSPALKDPFAAKLREIYGSPSPREWDRITYASMDAAAEGRIRACVLLGGSSSRAIRTRLGRGGAASHPARSLGHHPS